MTAEIYGRASIGTIFGFIFSAMNIGVGVGSIIAGRDYDITGNYQLALMINAFLGFAAAAVVQAVRVRPLVPPAPTPRQRLSSVSGD
jgi:predicted MFS family arabinose efflux permease